MNLREIDLDVYGIEVVVFGYYHGELAATEDMAPEDAFFEIEEVHHKGENITDLLSDEAMTRLRQKAVDYVEGNLP